MNSKLELNVFSPREVIDALADRIGVRVSERTLRAKARELKACRELGNALFFTQDDVDRLIEGVLTCHSNSSSAAGSGTSPEPSMDSECERVRKRLARANRNR